MEVRLPYGKEILTVEMPEQTKVLYSKAAEYRRTKSETELVVEALEHPIGSLPVSELAKGKDKIVLITSDHTRPVPSKITLPLFLAEIRKGNPEADITILIATGFHRSTTREEMIEKFGADIVEKENIVVHKAWEDENMQYLGVLPSGGDLLINKIATEADLLVSEGFIEPHAFAGFSGGRKSVLPGIASQKTVFANHCAEFVAHDKARTGNLEGNPIHKDMAYAAEKAKLAFILNVVINEEKEVIAAFAGDAVKAHRAGCDFVTELSFVEATNADIVITTNGGYPLDQNIYQSGKSMTAAEASAGEGGVIIQVSRCQDGHGGEAFYKTFKEAKSMQEVEDRILGVSRQDTVADQWGSQIFARIACRHRVIYVADPSVQGILEDMHVEYAPTVEEALSRAMAEKGDNASITVIPDGISVIVKEK